VRKKIGKTWTPGVVHTASVLCDFRPSLLVTRCPYMGTIEPTTLNIKLWNGHSIIALVLKP
jgi:hypothetical protein